MNGHIGLIHALVPATVDLQVTIPESHPSARNLGAERVGSGTIIDPSGYILTVHYVTIGAASITVTLADGEEYPGQVVGQDQESGLSLVKIPGRDLPFLKMAAANSLALGQEVVMVASSGKVGRRVSGGYVSSMAGYDGEWEYMIDQSIRVTAFQSRVWRRHSGQLQGRTGGHRLAQLERGRQVHHGDPGRILPNL